MMQTPPGRTSTPGVSSVSGALRQGAPTSGGEVTAAAPSPDGRHVAYAVRVSSDSRLWFADLPSGRHASVLAEGEGSINEVKWSNDGRYVLYVTTSAENSTLEVVQTSSGQNELVYALGNISCAHWNPEGESIVFSGGRDGDWNIYLASASASASASGWKVTQVTSGGGDRFSSWSANGSSMLFSRAEGNGSNIWSLSLLGSLARVTNSSGSNIYPAQSRDGRLAFISDRTGEWGIWTMEGGSERQLVFPPDLIKVQPEITADSALIWSPNRSVVGLIDPTIPIDQQIFDRGTVYHLATVTDLNTLVGSAFVHPMAWLPGGTSLLAATGEGGSSLTIAGIIPSTQSVLRSGYGG